MKSYILIFICFLNQFVSAQLPEGFVYVNDVIPDLKVELRYFSSNNFVGKPINGYETNRLILSEAAAHALKLVQQELEQQGMCLLVFDGYRPQRAVNHFMQWAQDLNDTINKHSFYPEVNKKDLFKEEYIATRSGHSKGSTVDLTIFSDATNAPLDMGTDYDFFGRESWIHHEGLTEIQKKNRQILQTVMLKHGFNNYTKEWWHFTLKNEPFPNTYFDFPVK
jgi:D-alanyl-D-alanine dipeptidase